MWQHLLPNDIPEEHKGTGRRRANERNVVKAMKVTEGTETDRLASNLSGPWRHDDPYHFLCSCCRKGILLFRPVEPCVQL
mmetsp:Transcript_374/g.821  ORF Transcript_374/g.821 Transcript_374/m.821 type:complete len:80 (+) Transcript_374:169-408(+)